MIFSALLLMFQTVVHTSTPTPQQEVQAQADGIVDAHGQVYAESGDANADVDAALSRAAVSGKTVIVIMGANWCHDSKDLAVWLAAPRFTAMMQPRYEIVYIDAGTPQTGDGNNQDIVKRFGGKKQKNTPYVMIISSTGKLLNRDDARSWRNASSRGENAVYAYFAEFIPA